MPRFLPPGFVISELIFVLTVTAPWTAPADRLVPVLRNLIANILEKKKERAPTAFSKRRLIFLSQAWFSVNLKPKEQAWKKGRGRDPSRVPPAAASPASKTKDRVTALISHLTHITDVKTDPEVGRVLFEVP